MWLIDPRARSKAQVDEVVDIMRNNVEKVIERDSKLSDLDDRAGVLQQGASQFEQQACKLKKKYWWQDIKVRPLATFRFSTDSRADDDSDGNSGHGCPLHSLGLVLNRLISPETVAALSQSSRTVC